MIHLRNASGNDGNEPLRGEGLFILRKTMKTPFFPVESLGDGIDEMKKIKAVETDKLPNELMKKEVQRGIAREVEICFPLVFSNLSM